MLQDHECVSVTPAGFDRRENDPSQVNETQILGNNYASAFLFPSLKV